jgi:hypothetical protein
MFFYDFEFFYFLPSFIENHKNDGKACFPEWELPRDKKAKLSNQISGIDISLPRASFTDQNCQGDP